MRLLERQALRSFWKSPWLTIFLLLLDAVCYSLCWLGAYCLRQALNPLFPNIINALHPYIHALPLIVSIWICATAYYQHYSHRERISSLNQLSRIFKTVLTGFIGILAIATLFKDLDLGRSVIGISSVFVFFYLYSSRTFLRFMKRRLVAKGYGLTRVLIIGAGVIGKKVKNRIVSHPEVGFHLVGFVDDNPALNGTCIDEIPVLGTTRELVPLIKQHDIEEIFLAVPSMSQAQVMNLVVQCETTRVDFKIVSNIFEMITSHVKIDEIEDIPVIKLQNGHLPPSQAVAKRILDITVATLLIVILCVPALLISLLIVLDSKGPIIFKQARVGKDTRVFTMHKFRTMYTNVEPYAEAPMNPEDPRITRFGKLLRKTSLDEIPQLYNVLRGEMSMVGPRPEMPFIVEKYEPWQRRRLDVKPGITGLWQIVGRKNLPLYLNLEYDFYYIKNQSLLLDITILLKTIPVVLFGKGAF
jgi:exopolysaccharide biosynthesis polyprenyl glycosylphosphotransferase